MINLLLQLLNVYLIQQDLFLQRNLQTSISLEYHFLGAHKSNPFVSLLISVYVISSYGDIASISKHFPTKKSAAKYFSTLFAIYIPILLQKLLQETLKF